MKIYEEEPLITEKLWRKEGNFIKQCRSVQAEAKVIYEQEKKKINQVTPLLVTSFKWTVAATECYS